MDWPHQRGESDKAPALNPIAMATRSPNSSRAARSMPEPDPGFGPDRQFARAKSAVARRRNRPWPTRPVNSPSRTTTDPRDRTMSDPPWTSRPS